MPQALLHCDYYDAKRCNSCSLLHLGEEKSVDQKFSDLEKLVTRELCHAQSHSPRLHSAITPSSIFPSRCKAKFSVTGTSEVPIIGLIDSEFAGIELLHCPLHLPPINAIAQQLPALIKKFHLEPYDIVKRTGELKGIIIVTSKKTSQTIVRFVLRSKKTVATLSAVQEALMKQFPQISVVSANIQPKPAAILEGTEEIVLTPATVIEEQYNGATVLFAPQSFIQVTPEVTEKLYATLSALAAKVSPRLFIDLFCGSGGFSFAAATHAARGIGVELSTHAVQCAEKACAINHRENLLFYSADVEQWLSHYQGEEPELVIVNPPRRGLSKNTCEALIRLNPTHIFYSSCNPQTLMRDVQLLAAHYHCEALYPFDMFPLTSHLEVVAALVKSPLSSGEIRT